jgi:hypothetical protein
VGKLGKDIKRKTKTIGTQQTFKNLVEMLLEPYMGRGWSIVMDSTYMGELLAGCNQSLEDKRCWCNSN